jgi:hypothetical protein
MRTKGSVSGRRRLTRPRQGSRRERSRAAAEHAMYRPLILSGDRIVPEGAGGWAVGPRRSAAASRTPLPGVRREYTSTGQGGICRQAGRGPDASSRLGTRPREPPTHTSIARAPVSDCARALVGVTWRSSRTPRVVFASRASRRGMTHALHLGPRRASAARRHPGTPRVLREQCLSIHPRGAPRGA